MQAKKNHQKNNVIDNNSQKSFYQKIRFLESGDITLQTIN